MINTNDFDKGYKDGLEQAREGKKKNFLKLDNMRQQWKISIYKPRFIFAF
jgi:hypothetical protein